jgi:hypothetical protein
MIKMMMEESGGCQMCVTMFLVLLMIDVLDVVCECFAAVILMRDV